MAYWKIYGHSMTCSECGYCGVYSGNYCTNCGAQMNEEARWWIPPMPKIESIRIVKCPSCGREMVGNVNYCYDCGTKMEKDDGQL